MKIILFLCFTFCTESRGFIFGCQSVHAFCPLRCANGYLKDSFGCDLCHCADADPSTLHQEGQHHHITNPCIYTQSRCPLNCEYYVKGGTGCEFCMCDTTHTTTKKVTTTSTVPTTTTSMPANTTESGTGVTSQSTTADSMTCAIAADICNQKCNGEYLTDHKDCTFCVCKNDIMG